MLISLAAMAILLLFLRLLLTAFSVQLARFGGEKGNKTQRNSRPESQIARKPEKNVVA